jgi:hypothetical protein
MLEVATYTDGGNVPDAWREIAHAWNETWTGQYQALGELTFSHFIDLKDPMGAATLPLRSRAAAAIRNPDLLFLVGGCANLPAPVELGGIEITTHAPDGSNIEKRYPFLWAARRSGLSAMVATPYQKHRANERVNRLPHRSARRNLEFASRWDPTSDDSALIQILPLISLQDRRGGIAREIRPLLWSWASIGALLAHRLARRIADDGSQRAAASRQLGLMREQLLDLHRACMAATTARPASTLLVQSHRVIQTYNARPESGHWERGEGQFDSIDGRLMVTLDDIELFEPELAARPFEFWLPQLARGHPWIAEQQARGFGSKRLRNILVTLREHVTTRFADELSNEDWVLLRQNPRLCHEREDRWTSGLYRIVDATDHGIRGHVAELGLSSPSPEVTAGIARLLNDPSLFYASFRGYGADWVHDLSAAVGGLPSGSRVLIPRLPRAMLVNVASDAVLVPAEDCTKLDLMMLRQLHRFRAARIKPWVE